MCFYLLARQVADERQGGEEELDEHLVVVGLVGVSEEEDLVWWEGGAVVVADVLGFADVGGEGGGCEDREGREVVGEEGGGDLAGGFWVCVVRGEEGFEEVLGGL